MADADALTDDDLRPWMYRVARNRAISLIRSREGEGTVRRSAVPLGDAPVAALVVDDADAHRDLAEDEVLRDSVARVHRALEQMPAIEREILRLCAIDGVSIRSAVELTGLSKKQVERTRTRALERFKVLVGAPVGDDCRRARALIIPGHLVDQPLADWRDAHLSGCLGCQIEGDMAYGKRLQSLAPLLPVSQAVPGKLQVLWAKLSGVFGVGGGSTATAKLAAGGAALVAAASVGPSVARSIAADAPPAAPPPVATTRATRAPGGEPGPAGEGAPGPSGGDGHAQDPARDASRPRVAARAAAGGSASRGHRAAHSHPTPSPAPTQASATPAASLRPAAAAAPGTAFSQEFSP